ncbi:hypothetical protein U1Q18_038070 [Sarracenia purpurea var. burkii]
MSKGVLDYIHRCLAVRDSFFSSGAYYLLASLIASNAYQNKEDSVDDKSKKNITIEVDLHEDIFPSYSGEGGTNSQQYQQEVESKDR